MIDIRQVNEQYSVGREKPGGKLYVIAKSGAHVGSFSNLTKTMEWYQSVEPDDKTVIESYLRSNY
jgi:hypothetical protein